MTRYIFVDFDGVLVTPTFQIQQGSGKLDPVRVRILSQMARLIGARIVVTSSWRSTLTDARQLFKKAGLANPQTWIVGITPRLNLTRADEISAWMFEHGCIPQENIAILDDDDFDMGVLLPRLVKTNPNVGLTVEDARRAIELFCSVEVAP